MSAHQQLLDRYANNNGVPAPGTIEHLEWIILVREFARETSAAQIDDAAIHALNEFLDAMPERGTPEYDTWLRQRPQPAGRFCERCRRTEPCEACEQRGGLQW